MLSVRTIKSDVVVGLPDGVAERLDKEEPGWKISGKVNIFLRFGVGRASIEPSAPCLVRRHSPLGWTPGRARQLRVAHPLATCLFHSRICPLQLSERVYAAWNDCAIFCWC